MAQFLSDITSLRARARAQVEKGPITEAYGADRARVVEVLNEALATEIVSPCATSATTTWRLVCRRGRLPPESDFDPDGLASRSHAEYVEGNTLLEMIREDLVAERVAIASYQEIIRWLGDKDYPEPAPSLGRDRALEWNGRMNPEGAMNLSAQETEDLLAVLDDEFRAHATYSQILEDFGDINPFANIREAEGRHIQALLGLLDSFEVPVPPNDWPGRVPRYSSVEAACAAGVTAEIENAALYDRVLSHTSRTELVTVYQNLERASRENHLRAFQRCAETRGTRPGSAGPRRRRFRARRGHR
jgi:hypothetical protein